MTQRRIRLAQLLFDSAQLLGQVHQGRSMATLLPAVPSDRRAGVQALSYYCLRHWPRGEALSRQLLVKKAPNPRLKVLLDTALTLLSALDFYRQLTQDEELMVHMTPQQVAMLQQSIPQYDEHTLVDQAVQATQQHRQTRPFRGLVNACLRRYQRERKRLVAHAWLEEPVRYGFAPWWIDAIRTAYPQQWQSILLAAQQMPTLCLRVNARQQDREGLMATFEAHGVSVQVSEGAPMRHLDEGSPTLRVSEGMPEDAHVSRASETVVEAAPASRESEVMAQGSPEPLAEEQLSVLAPHALYLQDGVNITQLPGFEQGWFSVQDLAAQFALAQLPLSSGMRVLDACAAPGGKTAHLLEHYDLDMTNVDVEASRLARVHENLQRLGLIPEVTALAKTEPSSGAASQAQAKAHVQSQARVLTSSPKGHLRSVVADVSDLAAWYDGQPFDAILADVPCTASGIVRRHPDIRWLRQASDVAQTVALQRQIVTQLWQTLAPGGYLLYVTCSIFPQEGEEQAQYFQTHLEGATRLAALGQLLPLADQDGRVRHDGFFYALFQKQSK